MSRAKQALALNMEDLEVSPKAFNLEIQEIS